MNAVKIATPLKPAALLNKAPPMIPPNVVPAYMAALKREDAVPRAVVVKFCSNAMRIGKVHPFIKKIKNNIISANIRFGANGRTIYKAAKQGIEINKVLESPKILTIRFP